MYILLAVLGEVASVAGTLAITLKGGTDLILEITENGYKFPFGSKEEMEAFLAKSKEKRNNKKGLKDLYNKVSMFIPGVNLITASVNIRKMKKEVLNDPETKKIIVPMTDKEKEQYSKMDGKLQKLQYIIFLTENNKEKEFVGFIGHHPLAVDHGLLSIYFDEILPLNYTLEEIKRLNDATGYTYRVGKIDGRNVAVIGIPEPDKLVSRITFKSEDCNIKHDYNRMTDEEAEGKEFAVYPFSLNQESKEKLVQVIEEIKNSRVDAAVKANMDELRKFFNNEPDTTIQEEQNGPVLGKRLQ